MRPMPTAAPTETLYTEAGDIWGYDGSWMDMILVKNLKQWDVGHMGYIMIYSWYGMLSWDMIDMIMTDNMDVCIRDDVNSSGPASLGKTGMLGWNLGELSSGFNQQELTRYMVFW